jgi:hypothetical protein
MLVAAAAVYRQGGHNHEIKAIGVEIQRSDGYRVIGRRGGVIG